MPINYTSHNKLSRARDYCHFNADVPGRGSTQGDLGREGSTQGDLGRGKSTQADLERGRSTQGIWGGQGGHERGKFDCTGDLGSCRSTQGDEVRA